MASAKQAAKDMLEQVPDKATWDEIMYELYIKQKIDSGLTAVENGQIISHEEVKRRLLNSNVTGSELAFRTSVENIAP